jgi:hypothetical protein
MLMVLMFTAALAGCSSEQGAPVGASEAEVAKSAGERVPAYERYARSCPVTSPAARVATTSGDFNHGDDSLAVELWPKGRLVAGNLPDGSSYAEIAPDGSIEAKLGWWRGVEGQLSITGERLDASAPSLRADTPSGYGPAGFQPSGLTFPTEGCWEIIGSVDQTRLTAVVLVRKR